MPANPIRDDKIVITCPKCGSPDVTVAAVARWGILTQKWETSETFDNKTCGSCCYEGNTFYNTPFPGLTPSQKAYIHGKVDTYETPHSSPNSATRIGFPEFTQHVKDWDEDNHKQRLGEYLINHLPFHVIDPELFFTCDRSKAYSLFFRRYVEQG